MKSSPALSRIESLEAMILMSATEGTSSNDVFDGGTGADNFDGGDGDDVINGNAGNDTLFGGDGNDTISDGAGNDTINGGKGNDTFTVGGGKDTYDGGEGSDTAVFSKNYSSYTIKVGNDGKVSITGPDGGKTLVNVEKLQFADRTINLSGPSELNGTENADNLKGTNFADTINAGAGDDTIQGSKGNDVIEGGEGEDTVVFSRRLSDYMIEKASDTEYLFINKTDGVTTVKHVEKVVFSDRTLDIGTAGNDTITGTKKAEVIHGNDGNDTLDGGAGNDSVHGGAGNDTISDGDGNDLVDAGEGDDTLLAGNGNDTLDGGAGFDTVIFDGDSSAYRVVDKGEAGVQITHQGTTKTLLNVERIQFTDRVIDRTVANQVNGTEGADELRGTLYNDDIRGGTGDDVVFASKGTDLIDGGTGVDTVIFSRNYDDYTVVQISDTEYQVSNKIDGTTTLRNIDRVKFQDLTWTIDDNGGNSLQSPGKAHRIDGNGGDDVIQGSDSRDEIYGGAGNDTINAGKGSDKIDGGKGADTVVFNDKFSKYKIKDLGSDGFQVTGPEGTKVIKAVEKLQFTDQVVLLNKLVGTEGNDALEGGDGDDSIYGKGGDDVIDGGEGRDTVGFSGSITDYEIFRLKDGSIRFIDLTGKEGIDVVKNVENFEFADGKFTLETLPTTKDLAIYDTRYQGVGGSIWGDPHFVGDDGDKYDVQGEVGKTYSLLSDLDLQVNAKFTAWGNSGATVMGQVGILAGSDQVELAPGKAPLVNGVALATGGSITANGTTISYDGRNTTVITAEYKMTWISQGSHFDARIVPTNPFADNVAPHGLWGLTVDNGTAAKVGDDVWNTGNFNKSQGGGAIDTLDANGNSVTSSRGDVKAFKLYETTGLFSTTTKLADGAKFIRFSATSGTGLNQTGVASDGTSSIDLLRGTNAADVVNGLDGNDVLAGFGGNDNLNGGNGDDRVDGGIGNDILRGGAGADTLLGGVGDDQLFGDAGDDLAVFSEGSDVFDGGDGSDTIVFTSLKDITVSQRPDGSVDFQSTAGTTNVRNVEFVKVGNRVLTLADVVAGKR